MRYYAGIGSRTTPQEIQLEMTKFAAKQARDGWTLRSGGAPGADKAFENGARAAGGLLEIFRPKECIPAAIELASTILEPAHWANCSDYARNCHGRNCMQILGRDLETPVEVVFCWTPNGEPVGGTRTGILLAERHQIPVINLAKPAGLQLFLYWLNGIEY